MSPGTGMTLRDDVVGGVMAASTSPAEAFEAGPTGLFVIALLAIGVFFLGRSMVKHLKRVPPSFDPPPSSSTQETEWPVEPGAAERPDPGRFTQGPT